MAFLDNGCNFGRYSARQKAWHALDNRYRCLKLARHCGKLESDKTSANDRQPATWPNAVTNFQGVVERTQGQNLRQIFSARQQSRSRTNGQEKLVVSQMATIAERDDMANRINGRHVNAAQVIDAGDTVTFFVGNVLD
jgi:hypothetical protein